MFALRRLSCRAPRALTAVPTRSNAQLTAVTDSPVAQPPPPAAVASEFAEDVGENTGTRGRRRRKRIPTKRPAISTESPKKWNRPLAEGVLPAYDMALKVIKTDSIRLKEEAKELRTRIGFSENTFQELSAKTKELSEDSQERQSLTEEVNLLDEQLEAMRVKLNILEVQSEINLPDVRWRVANAMGQFLFCPFFLRSDLDSFSM
jgi:large subunit ribosomal protein L35